jgi:hypothetical protein
MGRLFLNDGKKENLPERWKRKLPEGWKLIFHPS